MEIIAHASNTKPGDGVVTSKKLVDAINHSKVDTIEVDLNLTSDNKFVCVHNQHLEKKKIFQTPYEELFKINPDILTIDEVLEIVKTHKNLLLDVKMYGNRDYEIYDTLVKLLKYTRLRDNVTIESTDIELLSALRYEYPFINEMIIANLFSNQDYILNSKAFKKSDGIALSSEFFIPTKKYLKYQKALNENQKMYAWTWRQIYDETDKKFDSYINAGCDGIICEEVNKLVRRLEK